MDAQALPGPLSGANVLASIQVLDGLALVHPPVSATRVQRLRLQLIGYLAAGSAPFPGGAAQTNPSEAQFERALQLRDWVVANHAQTGTLGSVTPPLAHAPQKSALLLRLLAGQAPLRSAPPLSFGYPNYALIEAPVDTEHPASAEFIQMAQDAGQVLIDQARWKIVGRNQPAEEIQSMLLGGADAFDGQRFLSLVATRPVWTVRYEAWPTFELITSTRITVGRSDRVDRMRAPSSTSVCSGTWGPAEALTPALWTQLRVGCWALRKSQAWGAAESPEAQQSALYLDTGPFLAAG